MKKLLILLLILFIFCFGFFIYNIFSYLNVVVKFDDLEPFEKPMNVYFKGFKIGKTVKIYPNEDYTNTYLKLKLKRSKTRFPKNIVANIRKKRTGGYVDILFPDDPVLAKLKNNDEIKGNITNDISSLLESENIEDIVVEAESLVESANSAVQNLNNIFVEINKIIVDNRSNIDLIISNFAKTSKNFEDMSSKLNSSVDKNKLEYSVDNISSVTKNFDNITSQVDNVTLPILNNILCETNQTVRNTKDITLGVKKTLKKRMGLSKLLFGRPISDECE